jgi:hypothetical protein
MIFTGRPAVGGFHRPKVAELRDNSKCTHFYNAESVKMPQALRMYNRYYLSTTLI